MSKLKSDTEEEAEEAEEAKYELNDLYFTLNNEIESYDGINKAFLIGKLKELDDLTQHPSFNKINMSAIRLLGRTIKKKLLLILKEVIKKADILDVAAPAATPDVVAAAQAEAAVNTDTYPGPNIRLIAWRKHLIDEEFSRIGVPPFPPLDPDNSVYTSYLQAFDGIRIFTLKSYDNEHTPHGQCLGTTFIPDGTYDVGRFDNINNGPDVNFHRKYYERGNFDTENLLRAIIYRRILPPDGKINLLTLSYTYDPDADDLQELAQNDFFSIYTVYGIVKRMTAFFATGRIDDDMRYLKAFKVWLEDPENGLGDPIITAFLLKRIGVMTELLWYVLYKWPIIISPCPDTNPPINPCNIKLYAGIGTSNRDANYQVFIAGLFPGAEDPADANSYDVVAANPHDSGAFHTGPGLPPPVPGQSQITSRDFVSTAYSFDAATRFCKPGPIPQVFCMLEFILGPGKKLPFIGSSANEAEVLLKPGNVYQFIKRYRVKYFRHSFTGPQKMLIYIYQFLLVGDTNTILTFPHLPHDPLDPDPLPPELYTQVDFNNHRDWSIRVNDLMRVFGVMANTGPMIASTQDGSSLDSDAGGSKSNRNSKSKRRQHNKRRKTKRRQYKRQTNKRRKTKRRTNKRRTNKRRRI
jgi:hypothetical protein